MPWEIHPALSEDRLRICARLLAHARRDAIRMASYEMGDTTWSVGCRAYAFGQQRMRRVAEKQAPTTGSACWTTATTSSS